MFGGNTPNSHVPTNSSTFDIHYTSFTPFNSFYLPTKYIPSTPHMPEILQAAGQHLAPPTPPGSARADTEPAVEGEGAGRPVGQRRKRCQVKAFMLFFVVLFFFAGHV